MKGGRAGWSTLVGLSLAMSAGMSSRAGAQWRQATGASRVEQSAAPAALVRALPASRADYGVRGVLLGVAAGLALGVRADLDCDDCMIPTTLLTVPLGGLLGGAVGLTVWDARYGAGTAPEELPPMQSGLVRYMILGAAAGGGMGAGAIGGAAVYGIVHRRRR